MADRPVLIPPILIVGPNRSGKSLLARCFSCLDRVVWWSEPNTIWRIGNPSAETDRRNPEEATSSVKEHIRRAYLKKQKVSGGRRIVDDSPLHCVNVSFVRQVLPEAKIIHVFRDGRDAVADVLRSWQKPMYSFNRKTLRFVVRRLRETPAWEWWTYLPRIVQVISSKAHPRNAQKLIRGVRYPGIEHDVEILDGIELACKQWQVCQSLVLNDLAALPPDSYVCVAYEAFVQNPVDVFNGLLQFVDEPMSEKCELYLRRHITKQYLRPSGELDLGSRTLADIQPLLEPALSRIENFASRTEPRIGVIRP